MLIRKKITRLPDGRVKFVLSFRGYGYVPNPTLFGVKGTVTTLSVKKGVVDQELSFVLPPEGRAEVIFYGGDHYYRRLIYPRAPFLRGIKGDQFGP